jgi:hypothetical protein
MKFIKKIKKLCSQARIIKNIIKTSLHKTQKYINIPLTLYPRIFYLKLLFRASKGTLRRWALLHLQLLAPTNSHWACVVGYGRFSLWVIHKEGLCPSNGDINRLMVMMMNKYLYMFLCKYIHIIHRNTQTQYKKTCSCTPMFVDSVRGSNFRLLA